MLTTFHTDTPLDTDFRRLKALWRDVLAEGVSCGLHKIERLMWAQVLRARPRRRGLPKDEGDRLLAEGWLYVAAVIDLFSRRVVGWSMKAEMPPLGSRRFDAGRSRSTLRPIDVFPIFGYP